MVSIESVQDARVHPRHATQCCGGTFPRRPTPGSARQGAANSSGWRDRQEKEHNSLGGMDTGRVTGGPLNGGPCVDLIFSQFQSPSFPPTPSPGRVRIQEGDGSNVGEVTGEERGQSWWQRALQKHAFSELCYVEPYSAESLAVPSPLPEGAPKSTLDQARPLPTLPLGFHGWPFLPL